MRWSELEPGDILLTREEPEYVVLAAAGARIKLLQLDEGVIFDYMRSSAHVEAYGYTVTRNNEVIT